jgi:hypothetical protein
MAVAGEQPHALSVALDDQAIAVVLDFVQPVGPGRNLGSAGGQARFERNLVAPDRMAQPLCNTWANCVREPEKAGDDPLARQ